MRQRSSSLARPASVFEKETALNAMTALVVFLVIAGMGASFYAGDQYGKRTVAESPYIYSSYMGAVQFRTNKTTGIRERASATGWVPG